MLQKRITRFSIKVKLVIYSICASRLVLDEKLETLATEI